MQSAIEAATLPAIDLTKSYGPVVIGIILSCILYGMSCVQTILYSMNFSSKDRVWLKCLVRERLSSQYLLTVWAINRLVSTWSWVLRTWPLKVRPIIIPRDPLVLTMDIICSCDYVYPCSQELREYSRVCCTWLVNFKTVRYSHFAEAFTRGGQVPFLRFLLQSIPDWLQFSQSVSLLSVSVSRVLFQLSYCSTNELSELDHRCDTRVTFFQLFYQPDWSNLYLNG